MPAHPSRSAIAGTDAIAVAVSPTGDQVYVLSNSDEVDVMDAHTGRLLHSVSVDHDAQGFALTPDGSTLYVASEPDDITGPGYPVDSSVEVINTRSDKQIANIALPAPKSIAVNGRFVYVADQNGIDVISTATNSVTETINTADLGGGLDEITVSHDGSFVYGVTGVPLSPVTSGSNAPDTNGAGAAEVVTLDTLTKAVLARISIPGPLVTDIAADPRANYVYVTTSGPNSPSTAGTVWVLDGTSSKIVAKVGPTQGAGGVGFSPDGRLAYVTDPATADIMVINTATRSLIRTIAYRQLFGQVLGRIPEPAGQISIAPNGSYAYLIGTYMFTLGSPTVELVKL